MWNLKRISAHILFWVIATLFLWLFISSKSDNGWLILKLVSLLIPVTAFTSYTFNYYLVENKLLAKKYVEFTIYGIFTFVFSVYLQFLTVTFVFAKLANYRPDSLGPIALNIAYIGICNYLLVFLSALIYLFKRNQQVKEITVNQPSQPETLHLKADRKTQIIPLSDIYYIESLSNYVKVHTPDKTHITKEKISKLEEELPDSFIRIHRSFLINQIHVKNFNKEKVTINEVNLTISRTFKKQALDKLNNEGMLNRA